MKKSVLFLVLLSFLIAFAHAQSITDFDKAMSLLGTKHKEAIGKPFGDFLITADSAIIQQACNGKTVFVNLRLEACAPYHTEVDGLNPLYKQTKTAPDFIYIVYL